MDLKLTNIKSENRKVEDDYFCILSEDKLICIINLPTDSSFCNLAKQT